MISAIEKKLTDYFVSILPKHWNNGKYATDELVYRVYIEHSADFHNLSESDQWIVRNFIDALRKIYG